MDKFICKGCGQDANIPFAGIPCSVSPEKDHKYCPHCQYNVLCKCVLPIAEEIYVTVTVFPWAGKRCGRCYGTLTVRDNVYSEEDIRTGGKHHYHHKCWDKGQQEMEEANHIIAEYKIVIPQPKESISFQE